jgi:hypothetical protein
MQESRWVSMTRKRERDASKQSMPKIRSRRKILFLMRGLGWVVLIEGSQWIELYYSIGYSDVEGKMISNSDDWTIYNHQNHAKIIKSSKAPSEVLWSSKFSRFYLPNYAYLDA